jgi:chlorobactene glucosyltransferase
MTILAIIILACWIGCVFQAILGIILMPRLQPAERVSEDAPAVSVIIPARDEERAIEGTLRGFLAQEYPRLEVILVDDQSTDRTAAIAREIAATDSRLRVVSGDPPPHGWLGKPWAHHQGALVARGELFLFVDADIMYQPGAVASAVDCLERAGAGLVTLLPRVVMRGFWEHVVLPQVPLVVFLFLPGWLSNRVQWSKLAIGGGTGMLVRRDAYDAAGGHEPLRNAIVDDVSLARIVRKVAPTIAVRADDFVSVRIYEGLGEVVRGFTKNFYFVLGANVPLALGIVVLTFLMHVVPYVWAINAAIDRIRSAPPTVVGTIGLLTIAVIALARLIVFVPLRYGIVNAIFAHPLMSAVWIYIGLRSIWVVGIRRQVGWRGRVYDARIKRFGG